MHGEAKDTSEQFFLQSGTYKAQIKSVPTFYSSENYFGLIDNFALSELVCTFKQMKVFVVVVQHPVSSNLSELDYCTNFSKTIKKVDGC